MRNEVELITIGDELLLGFTVDTNGVYVSRALAEIGIAVARRTAVGDSADAIATAVSEALDRTGAVITTGGLGPTSDDVTRDGVARVFGRELTLDEEHLEWMRHRWRKRFDRDLPDANRRQAMLPRGSRKLENRHGSAPGVWIEDDSGRWVVMLPGVPRELRGMMADSVLQLLRSRTGGASVIRSRTLRTTGIAESLLADRLAGVDAVLGAPAQVSLAYLPGVEGVDLRVTVKAADEAAADGRLAEAAAALRERVAEHVYGEGDTDLASVLLDKCRSRRLRIAVAESCTGGLLGARLTSIPGSSDVFLGGVIAYADAVKFATLGVQERDLREYGAVSEQVVRQMAVGVKAQLGAEMGLSITGIAGPGGGTAEKPVGLVWICAAVGERVESSRLQLWGDRQEIRYRAAQATMALARRLLVDSPGARHPSIL